MNDPTKRIQIRTAQEQQYVHKFDGIARSNGLSRFKLMSLLIKWIATGLVDISQLIRLEQDSEANENRT